MSQSLKPTLAALIGVASLSATAHVGSPDLAPVTWQNRTPTAQASGTADHPIASTLGDLLEKRIERAWDLQRYGEVDELTTLWLTLNRRQQLGREVERGPQFVNVSLKNQRLSEHRRDRRALQRYAPEEAGFHVPSPTFDPLEAIHAERIVEALDEPYRTAVRYAMQGLNHREVAEKMGVSHAAVRKWAQRLRERIDIGAVVS